MPLMKMLELELKLHMVDETTSLLYQEMIYFMKLHIYWFINAMIFTGPSQKNTLSRVFVLQPKAIVIHWFILKVPCLIPSFGWPQMTTIRLQDQSSHLFYQDYVKKMVLLILQLTFVQDSQVLLLPQVLTIVTWFLDMTLCVQFLKIISACANIGKWWLHQTLLPEVWIYAAGMIRTFFIPSTLCVSQEYFQSDIFLTFTCNMRNTLCCKTN